MRLSSILICYGKMLHRSSSILMSRKRLSRILGWSPVYKRGGMYGTVSSERYLGKWCCLRAVCRSLESVGRPRVCSLARDPPGCPLARYWVRDRCAQPDHSRRGIASRNHGYSTISAGFDLSNNSFRLLRTAFRDQPSRRFGNTQYQCRINHRRNSKSAQHPSPVVGSSYSFEKIIGKKSNQDAEDNIELKHPGEASAVFRGRDFGDVKRRGDCRDRQFVCPHATVRNVNAHRGDARPCPAGRG